MYAPSAKAARGGKFRFLPGSPGYVTVGVYVVVTLTYFLTRPTQPTEIPDPTTLVEAFKRAAINAKEAGFDGVEHASFASSPAYTISSDWTAIWQFTARMDILSMSSWIRLLTSGPTHGEDQLRNVPSLVLMY